MSIDSSPTGNKERSDYCSELTDVELKKGKDKQHKLYRLSHDGPAFAQVAFGFYHAEDLRASRRQY